MFLDFMKGCTENPVGYPVRHSLAREHYNIKLFNPDTIKEIEYEKFDYNIIPEVDPNNPFANTLVNEMWPFFRMLWRTRGGYMATVKFNPEIDLREFGTQYGPGAYTANFKFIINDDGDWSADFDFDFNQHVENPDDIYYWRPEDRRGPFYAQDYSRMKSNTATRARRLAKPEWDEDTGRTDDEFDELIQEEIELNNTIDFTFNYQFKGKGSWGDHKKYEVEVSKVTKSTVIPEKQRESVFSIGLKDIKRKKK